MIIPERTETSEKRDDEGIDQELVKKEILAMLGGAYGSAPTHPRGTIRPGDLTVRFESVHDEE